MNSENLCDFKLWLYENTDLTEGTIKNYISVLKDLNINQDVENIGEFINKSIMEKNRKTNASVLKFALKKLMIFWKRQDVLSQIAIIRKQKRKRFGHYADFNILKSICEGIETPELRMIAYIQLYTGIRAAEVIGIRHKNISWDYDLGATIQIVGKDNKKETIFIPIQICTEIGLKPFLDERRMILRHPFIVPCSSALSDEIQSTYMKYWRALKVAAKNKGIPEFSTHDFRRNFAQRMIERGFPLESVQKALHHSNINNTLRYKEDSPFDFKELMNSLYK